MNISTPKDHLYQLEKPQKMNKKNIILLATGIICIILVGYFWGGQKIALAPSSDLTEKNNEENNNNLITSPSSKIIVSNQIPGEVVMVTEVTMSEAGWIAVHDNNDNVPGNILGAYYLPEGTHKNQMIPLLRAVAEDKSYFVIIHKDDGDRVFNHKIDLPALNSLGKIETIDFRVAVESPRGDK